MRGNKLFSIVEALPAKDRKKLIEFAKCPIFNTRAIVVKCLVVACKHHLKFLNQELQDKDLFKLIFSPTQKYSEEKLRETLHFSQVVLNDYLIQLKLAENDFLKKELLSQYYLENVHFDYYTDELKKMDKFLQSQKIVSRQNEKNLFELKIKQYLTVKEDYIKNKKSIVEEALIHLDTYYFMEKLKWSHELLGSSQHSSHNYDIPFLSQVLVEIQKEPYASNSFASTYYLITLFYKDNYSLEKYQRITSAYQWWQGSPFRRE